MKFPIRRWKTGILGSVHRKITSRLRKLCGASDALMAWHDRGQRYGVCYPAKAVLEEAKILLACEDMKEKPEEVRYCYRDTNSGALVYNAYGLPMSPFKISL